MRPSPAVSINGKRYLAIIFKCAEIFNWGKVLDSCFYAPTSKTQIHSKLIKDVNISFVISSMGLLLPETYGSNYDSDYTTHCIEHNKKRLSLVLGDYNSKFINDGTMVYYKDNLESVVKLCIDKKLHILHEYRVDLQSALKSKETSLESILETCESEVSDGDLEKSYLDIINDPSCSHNVKVQALDKISKIRGAYRQNKQAIDKQANVQPIFNFVRK
jgi:hypothetical protein